MNQPVPHLAELLDIVERGPRSLFATLSGAHLYGFESPDSDLDLRGAFVAPVEQVLRLRQFKETLSVLEERDGLELDWVTHDVAKFARLMTKRGGYALEQLYSPLVVQGGAWIDELREIGEGCITVHLHHHYHGFAASQRRLLEGGERTVKRLLYCYRVLMTGIHVLRSGRIESNLNVLDEDFHIDGLQDLIRRKRAGREKSGLERGETERHLPVLDELERRLEEAVETSKVSPHVTTFDALDDFVLRARMELGS